MDPAGATTVEPGGAITDAPVGAVMALLPGAVTVVPEGPATVVAESADIEVAAKARASKIRFMIMPYRFLKAELRFTAHRTVRHRKALTRKRLFSAGYLG